MSALILRSSTSVASDARADVFGGVVRCAVVALIVAIIDGQLLRVSSSWHGVVVASEQLLVMLSVLIVVVIDVRPVLVATSPTKYPRLLAP